MYDTESKFETDRALTLKAITDNASAIRGIAILRKNCLKRPKKFLCFRLQFGEKVENGGGGAKNIFIFIIILTCRVLLHNNS